MSDFSIPSEWVFTKLSDITDKIVSGGTPSKAIPSYFEGDIPWMSVKDLSKNDLNDTIDHITQEAVVNSATNIIPKGTPIIATRMSLGKIIVVNFDTAINQDLKAIFLAKQINQSFFVYWYKSQANLLESLGTGTTVKGIRLEKLNELILPLMPKAEQEKIAELLDSHLMQVENIKARLNAIIPILKKFRQSVLVDAVSGQLINNQPINDSDFKKISELDLTIKTGPFGSSLHKSEYITNGIPVINPSHIKHGKIFPSNEVTITQKKYEELKAWILKSNDVVIGRRGEMGRSAVVKVSDKFLCGTGSVIFRPNSSINSDYLSLCLRSTSAINYFNQSSVGSTMVNLNQKIINDLTIYMPDVEVQEKTVNQVEQLFAFADNIETQINNALQRVNHLTQSILHQAFTGQLTADWRAKHPELITGDNSAEKLLEQIQAAKQAQTPAKKDKAKMPKTTKAKPEQGQLL